MIKVQCDRCPAMVLHTQWGMASLTVVNHIPDRSSYQETLHLCQDCLADFRHWLRVGPIGDDGASPEPVGSVPTAAALDMGGLS